jgi:hypothetical protein
MIDTLLGFAFLWTDLEILQDAFGALAAVFIVECIAEIYRGDRI